jgi:hypothetical protein
MRFNRILALAFMLCLVKGFSKEWQPDFRVIKETKDSTLKNDVVFTFLFSDDPKEIRMSYNKTELTIHPKNGKHTLRLPGGKYDFKFYWDKNHNEVISGKSHYKGGHRVTAEVDFYDVNMPRVVEKPVIYLYPVQKTQVCVCLDVKGKLGFTYPPYNKGWDFTVDPSGTISKDGKNFRYLFWDAEVKNLKPKFEEGFVVKKNELLKFMEKKLEEMGLNAAEKEDFITYWCPRMMKSEASLVTFMFNESCNDIASLDIHPRPDNIFRVYMMWRTAQPGEVVKEQKIIRLGRKGFTVVEWGGCEVQAESDNRQ